MKITSNKSHIVTLDTLHLKAWLTPQQLTTLKSLLTTTGYPNASYHIVYHEKNYGFTLKLHPKVQTNYNAFITIQSKFMQGFDSANETHNRLGMLLLMFNWSITGLHTAFDFDTDFDDSMAYKSHGNIGHSVWENEESGAKSYYYGMNVQQNNENQKIIGRKVEVAIHYDRNDKDRDRRDMEIESSPHQFANRYELRMVFKMNEQLLHSVNHSLIEERLSKTLFVSAIKTSDGYFKRRLKIIRDDPSKLKSKSEHERKKMKQFMKKHREPLEFYYSENKRQLFSLLEFDQGEWEEAKGKRIGRDREYMVS